jgi:2-amino-4-hydroxy-6-hydroxymethyldihydropteridine diphosphokinase
MISFFLSLGSNVGDRLEYLQLAVQALREVNGIRIQNISGIYETDPVGYVDQPAFLNMVIEGETDFSATALLEEIMRIEQKLGRKRDVRWGPRTIDIDILLYGTQIIQEANLEIPHPRMMDRSFVLVPLAEVASDCLIPTGKDIYITPLELLAKVEDKSGVRKWKDFDWVTEFERFEN